MRAYHGSGNKIIELLKATAWPDEWIPPPLEMIHLCQPNPIMSQKFSLSLLLSYVAVNMSTIATTMDDRCLVVHGSIITAFMLYSSQIFTA